MQPGLALRRRCLSRASYLTFTNWQLHYVPRSYNSDTTVYWGMIKIRFLAEGRVWIRSASYSRGPGFENRNCYSRSLLTFRVSFFHFLPLNVPWLSHSHCLAYWLTICYALLLPCWTVWAQFLAVLLGFWIWPEASANTKLWASS